MAYHSILLILVVASFKSETSGKVGPNFELDGVVRPSQGKAYLGRF